MAGFSRAELMALMATLDDPIAAQIVKPKRRAATPVAASSDRDPSYDEWAKNRPKKGATGKSGKPAGKREISTVGHILDFLSRGNYASAEAFRRASNPNDDEKWDFTEGAKGFWAGLSGKKKTRFSDVLREHGNAEGHEGKAGFALDIFADPLTYLGVGLLPKAGKAAIEGAEALSRGSQVARFAERAKPDVVQLGELGVSTARNLARRVRPNPKGTPAQTAEAARRQALKTSDRRLTQITARAAAEAGMTSGKAVANQGPVLPAPVPGTQARAVEAPPPPVAETRAPAQILDVQDMPLSAAKPFMANARPKKTAKDFDEAVQAKTAEIFDKEFAGRIPNTTLAGVYSARATGTKAEKIQAEKILTVLRRMPEFQDISKRAEGRVKAEINAKPARQNLGELSPVAKERIAALIQGAKTVPDPLPTPAARVAEGGKTLSPSELKVAQDHAKAYRDNNLTPGGEKFDNMANAKSIATPHTDYTPIKQVNLWQQLRDDRTIFMGRVTKKDRNKLLQDPKHFERIVNILKQVENELEAMGKPAVALDKKTPLRLSTFLEELNKMGLLGKNIDHLTKIMRRDESLDDDMKALYDRIVAGAHLQDAAQAQHALVAVADAVKATDALPGAAAKEVLDAAPAAASKAVKNAGGSPYAAKTTRDVITNMAGATRAAKFDNVHHGGGKKGVISHDNFEEMWKRGTPATVIPRYVENTDKVLGIWIGPAVVAKFNMTKHANTVKGFEAAKPMLQSLEKAHESIMLRISTSRGRGGPEGEILNIGPDLQRGRARALNNSNQHTYDTTVRVRTIFQGKSPAEKARIFEEAQAAAKRGEEHPYADVINESIMLARRFQLPQDEIMQALRREYRGADPADIPFFPRDQVEGVEGIVKMADEGLTPFDAWRYVNIKDDKFSEHAVRFQTAIDKVYVEHEVWGDFAARFGSQTPYTTPAGPAIKAGPSDPRWMRGLYFDKESLGHARNLQAILKYAAENPGKAPNNFLKGYDKLLAGWKYLATRVNPQYYIRNGIGEGYINWTAGVRTKDYITAKKVMNARGLTQVDALDNVKPPKPHETAFNHPKWGDVSFDMVWRGFNVGGARQVYAVTDNLDSGVAAGHNPVSRGLDAMGNYEETYLRMADFVRSLQNSKQPTFAEAAQEAGAAVNRRHGNYSDLTDWERKYARRVIPFYTWQKKVTPILLESALRNPGKAMAYPKLQHAIAQRMGIESDDDNYLPTPEVMMPDWMQNSTQVPYRINEAGNVVMGDPGNPFVDQLETLNEPDQGLPSQLSPFIKSPIEMFVRKDEEFAPKGRTFFGDYAIRDRKTYLADQVPTLSTINRITRRDPANGFQPREGVNYGEDEQGMNWLALINWGTAAGMQEVTDRREASGEFERRKKEAKKRREAEKKAEKEAKLNESFR